jgi:glutarate dioxygenase
MEQVRLPHPGARCAGYGLEKLAESDRLARLVLDGGAVARFFDLTRDVSVRSLNYVPYTRFGLVPSLVAAVGANFPAAVRRLLLDRRTAGFRLDIEGYRPDGDDLFKLTTAIAFSVGRPDDDVLSGTFYGRMRVTGRDLTRDTANLYQPYLIFNLHTDGAAAASETTDWLTFAKVDEHDASGGRSMLLHLDDWSEGRRFAADPLGRVPLCFKLPPPNDPRQQQWGNHAYSRERERPLFFDHNGGLSIRFVDQFVHPRNLNEALFLRDVSASLQSAPGIEYVPIPVGSILMLNNNVWLHGREPFAEHPDLYREIVRMRGTLLD